MPMDRRRYPPDWPQISRRIRERDHQRCKWCGVANNSRGARDRYDVWHDERDIDRMNSTDGDQLFPDGYPKIITIILTVAHLGVPKEDGQPGDRHDKMDCRDENLASLCQRCHLNYDRAEHLAVQRKNRASKRGRQLPLFAEV
jgi:hypothetical protein